MEHVCPCGAKFEGRADATTCSPRCRKRLERGDFYVVTDEDRAVIARIAAANALPMPKVAPGAVPLLVIRPREPKPPRMVSLEEWRERRRKAER